MVSERSNSVAKIWQLISGGLPWYSRHGG